MSTTLVVISAPVSVESLLEYAFEGLERALESQDNEGSSQETTQETTLAQAAAAAPSKVCNSNYIIQINSEL